MALSQNDIITKVTEIRQESVTSNSKQKLSVPRRIMEEEVWLSGSELKTDGSSDEERIAQSADIKDRIKKGAKKKTKATTQSSRSRTKIVREQRQQDKSITETVQTIKEISSTTTTTATSSSAGDYDVIVVDTSEVQWRPKRGSITLPGLATELERVQI